MLYNNQIIAWKHDERIRSRYLTMAGSVELIKDSWAIVDRAKAEQKSAYLTYHISYLCLTY